MMAVFNRSDRIAGSFSFILTVSWGFLGGSSGKEPTCQCRGHKRGGFNSWVGKVPWSRNWQPAPVFLLGEFHGQRSLGATVHGVTNLVVLFPCAKYKPVDMHTSLVPTPNSFLFYKRT